MHPASNPPAHFWVLKPPKAPPTRPLLRLHLTAGSGVGVGPGMACGCDAIVLEVVGVRWLVRLLAYQQALRTSAEWERAAVGGWAPTTDPTPAPVSASDGLYARQTPRWPVRDLLCWGFSGQGLKLSAQNRGKGLAFEPPKHQGAPVKTPCRWTRTGQNPPECGSTGTRWAKPACSGVFGPF